MVNDYVTQWAESLTQELGVSIEWVNIVEPSDILRVHVRQAGKTGAVMCKLGHDADLHTALEEMKTAVKDYLRE